MTASKASTIYLSSASQKRKKQLTSSGVGAALARELGLVFFSGKFG